MSSINTKFAEAMRTIERLDPKAAHHIKRKVEALKSEAATYRRGTRPSTVQSEGPLTTDTQPTH